MKPKASYDDKTLLTLLDIFGSCITDVFYNHLYDRAISIHEKTSRSITQCYRRVVADYIQESDNSKFYTMLLNSLHHYLRMSTIYSNIPYTDCITLYTGLFVPSMYLQSLTAKQKVDILSMIIKNSVTLFANEIIEEHLGGIIDDHTDPINIEVLQDCILKILLQEREENYKRFVQSHKSESAENDTLKQSSRLADELSDEVDSEYVEKPRQKHKHDSEGIVRLSNAFKKSLQERASLKKKNSTLAKRNQQLAKQFMDLKEMFLTQIDIQKDQAKTIQDLKTQMQKNMKHVSIQVDTKQENELEETKESEFTDDLFSVEYIES